MTNRLLGNGEVIEMEFENDKGNGKAADESAGRSVSDVLTEEEEIRIWKREG